MKKRTWKVHTIANCSNCGWGTEEYRNGQAISAIHAKKYGHTVRGEVGLAFEYNSSSSQLSALNKDKGGKNE